MRLWAFFAGPSLDAELANGISPSTSILLGTRADWVTSRRARRTVAQALRRAVEAAERPPARCLQAGVPVDAGAIQVCRGDVMALAEKLATIERPSAYGVAIARQLAFDGRSPLFLQAPDRRQGGERRLACTLDAAQRALEVSSDFDLLEEFPTAA